METTLALALALALGGFNVAPSAGPEATAEAIQQAADLQAWISRERSALEAERQQRAKLEAENAALRARLAEVEERDEPRRMTISEFSKAEQRGEIREVRARGPLAGYVIAAQQAALCRHALADADRRILVLERLLLEHGILPPEDDRGPAK